MQHLDVGATYVKFWIILLLLINQLLLDILLKLLRVRLVLLLSKFSIQVPPDKDFLPSYVLVLALQNHLM